ncbi:MAG: hypothetical protein LBG99_03200 [Propionibacteriaceae bacterium]|jgi:hypothetical protein|nr:hypothetical protein [Propionibacteriaceae bacterium]
MGENSSVGYKRAGWFLIFLGVAAFVSVVILVVLYQISPQMVPTDVVFPLSGAGCVVAALVITFGVRMVKGRRESLSLGHSSTVADDSNPVSTSTSRDGGESDQGTLPIAAPKEAQGYGWMKASDLVKEREARP